MANSFTPANFFAQLGKIRFPTFEDLNENAVRFKQTGCRKSHDACVTAFLPLAYKIASGRRGIAEVDDLFQQGALAIMDAIRLFDPDAGLNIVSWVKLHIMRSVNRHCIFGTSLIKIPETKTIRLCYRRMSSYLKDGPLSEKRSAQLARELGVSLEDFKIARDLYSTSYEPIGNFDDDSMHGREIGGNETLEDLIVIEDEAQHISSTVGRLMTVLSPKEAEVIQMRCLQDEPVQLRLVGEKMGFSTERARQVENIAKKKMREAA